MTADTTESHLALEHASCSEMIRTKPTGRRLWIAEYISVMEEPLAQISVCKL